MDLFTISFNLVEYYDYGFYNYSDLAYLKRSIYFWSTSVCFLGRSNLEIDFLGDNVFVNFKSFSAISIIYEFITIVFSFYFVGLLLT